MSRNQLYFHHVQHVCPEVKIRVSSLFNWPYRSVKKLSSCQVLWKHHGHSSDIHGVHDIDNDAEDVLTDDHTEKLQTKRCSQHIELKPSRFISSWIRTPVKLHDSVKKSPQKRVAQSSEQITWDSKCPDPDSTSASQHHHPVQDLQTSSLLTVDVDKNSSQGRNKKTQDKVYNYGLPGLGKRSHNNREVVSYKRTLKPKGEILFGLFPVLLALQEGKREFYTLYLKKNLMTDPRTLVAEIMKLAEELGTCISPCTVNQLDQLSQSRPHQGVCLDVSKLKYEPFKHEEDTSLTRSCQIGEAGHHQVWMVLDSIQDPMNFGAVLRTAYFLGVDRVLTAAKNSCTLSPVVSKASAGALELMPVYGVHDMVTFLQGQRQHGWQVIGTVSEKSYQADQDSRHLLLHQLQVKKNTVMILGNEGVGLSSECLDLCDVLVTISPGHRSLNPRLDSLNVSVATGIILHHLMSSRQKD